MRWWNGGAGSSQSTEDGGGDADAAEEGGRFGRDGIRFVLEESLNVLEGRTREVD